MSECLYVCKRVSVYVCELRSGMVQAVNFVFTLVGLALADRVRRRVLTLSSLGLVTVRSAHACAHTYVHSHSLTHSPTHTHTHSLTHSHADLKLCLAGAGFGSFFSRPWITLTRSPRTHSLTHSLTHTH